MNPKRPRDIKPARVVAQRDFASPGAWEDHVDRMEARLCGHITWDDFPAGDGPEAEKARFLWHRFPHVEVTFAGEYVDGGFRRHKWRLSPSAPAEQRRKLACRAAAAGMTVVYVIDSVLVKGVYQKERMSG